MRPLPDHELTLWAGIEARGLISRRALRIVWASGFVPVRNQKSFPPKRLRFSYALEYGTDTL